MKNLLRILCAVLGLVSCPVFAQSIGQLQNGYVWGNASGSTGPASGYTIQQMITQAGFTSVPINGCTIGTNVLCTSGTASIFSSSASAFAVGLTGSTNPAFQVDSSVGSQVAGLKVTGAVTGGSVGLAAIDSGGSNTNLIINAKGTGTIGIGSVSTGAVTITPNVTHTGTTTLSSALTYGGVTLSNAVIGTGKMVLDTVPSFTFGTGAGSVITATSANTGFGNVLNIYNTGTASNSGTLAQIVIANTGTNATTYGLFSVVGGASPIVNIASGAGATGGMVISTGAGALTISPATTFSSAITYGGVALSNSVTGTGSMVLSSAPTIGSLTVTTAFTATGLVTYADMATAALATQSNFFAGTASTLVPASVMYTAEQTVTPSAGTLALDFNTFTNAVTAALAANLTSITVTNAKAGQSGQIRFLQDGTGSRTAAGWSSTFKFPGGAAPTLSTAPNAVDALEYSCTSTTYCVASMILNVK